MNTTTSTNSQSRTRNGIKKARKRVLTEARREQNRLNQRAYRQRQRSGQHSHGLRQSSQPEQSQSTVHSDREVQPPLQQQTQFSPSAFGLSGTEQDRFDAILEDSNIHELLLPAWPLPEIEHQSSGPLLSDWSIPNESSESNDVINHAHQNGPSPSMPELATPSMDISAATSREIPLALPSERNVGTDSSSSNDIMTLADSFSLDDVIAAGIETLLRRSTTTTPSHRAPSSPPLPSPWEQCIHFSQTHILLACIHNARSIGFKVADVMMVTAETYQFPPSPFYINNNNNIAPTLHSDPTHLLASVTSPSTPTHLKPTLPQVLYPHPAFMDLIPIPVFRARAITLLATRPQAIDLRELKYDLAVGNGIFCWSSSGGSSSSSRRGRSRANGQPWDMRSWEVAPWFLRKWRMLFEGEEGEIWKQSVWWQRARGEEVT